MLLTQIELVEYYVSLICFICVSISFQFFQQTHPGDDSTMLFLTIVDIFYSFGVVCLVCEIGQQISNAYDDIDDIINQLDWYLFPYQIQRMLPMVFINSQESVTLQCFGSISCDRDNSKKVSLDKLNYF